MTRTFVSGTLLAIAIAFAAPGAAQARVACPAEQTIPTAADSAQISDAIFCLTNQIRVSYGLPAFRRDARLDTAARLHSQDMASRDYFSHTTPEGLTPQDRADAQGYTSGVGENIAAGYRDARAVVLGWMASAGHCRNILGTARDIGVGTAATPRANYTQNFGNYDFGAASRASAGCPYTIDLDALEVPSDAPTSAPAAGAPSPIAMIAGPALSMVEEVVAPDPAPVVGGLSLAPGRLVAGRRGLITYTLSVPATVTLRIERRVSPGRYRTLPGRLVDRGDQGINTLVFRGRLNGRPLRTGTYHLRAVAADGAGDVSSPRRARFRIVRR